MVSPRALASKMAVTSKVLLSTIGALLLLPCALPTSSYIPRARFEYKLSFKGPHLIQKDKGIPFWDHGGDAIAGEDSIRITPSLRSKRGYVWSRNTVDFENWIVEIVFRISGRGRIGADGLAFWYTSQKGIEGPVFGSNDLWNGLGIFFDSFDNDAQTNNPYILAMLNNGSLSYDHHTDGNQQQLGGCMRDFRNKPFPVIAKFEYYKKVLTLYINSGMSNNPDAFEMCMRKEGVDLPVGGYFGLSAATGGLADDHDVLGLLTHSLHAPVEQVASEKVSEEDRKKYEQEFEDYRQKLEKAKEEYQKEHPDKVRQRQQEIDDSKWYESQGQRELKQIFDGQNTLHLGMRELNRRLEELLGRQELILSRVSAIGQTGQGSQQIQPQLVDSIKRHEVERVLNNQQELIQVLREMRNVVNEVHQKSQAHQGGGNMDLQLTLHELKDHMKQVRSDTTNILGRPTPQVEAGCPSASSCVTPVVFLFGLIAQVVAMLMYAMYKQNKEAQAKKFY